MAIVKKSLGNNPIDEDSVVVAINRELTPVLKETRDEVNRISGNPVAPTTTAYDVKASDRVLEGTTGIQTFTLLPAADVKEYWFTFKLLGGTSLAVAAVAGEEIDNANTVNLTIEGDSLTIYSNGTKYIKLAGTGTASLLTPRQDKMVAETITKGVDPDTTLADQLDLTPVSNASVKLYLNGLFQDQGPTFDYTVSGKAITWLVSSGTAVTMAPSDKLTAVYES